MANARFARLRRRVRLPASQNFFGMRPVAWGGRSIRRALKSPPGAFPRAPLSPTAACGRLWLGARSRGKGGATPRFRPALACAPALRLSARASQVGFAAPCLPLRAVPPPRLRLAAARSLRRFRLGSDRLRRSPPLYTGAACAPRGSPRRRPFLPLPLRHGGRPPHCPLRGSVRRYWRVRAPRGYGGEFRLCWIFQHRRGRSCNAAGFSFANPPRPLPRPGVRGSPYAFPKFARFHLCAGTMRVFLRRESQRV